jgi:hypothetical protein
MNRRSFFNSLSILGAAAAGCPGLFIPKFEAVRWKITPAIDYQEFNPRDYVGQWKWVMWHKSLTQTDVATLYNGGAGLPFSSFQA